MWLIFLLESILTGYGLQELYPCLRDQHYLTYNGRFCFFYYIGTHTHTKRRQAKLSLHSTISHKKIPSFSPFLQGHLCESREVLPHDLFCSWAWAPLGQICFLFHTLSAPNPWSRFHWSSSGPADASLPF